MLDMPFRYAYLWLRLQELRRFLAAASRLRQIQHDVLLAKLRRHADSDFGRAHDFAGIRSLDDFRRRLPITDYAYYDPYIERLKRGDLAAMFGPGTRLLMFAVTSGTTGKCKHIPVTAEFFAEYRMGWNLWAIGMYRDHPQLMRQKALKLASNWQHCRTPGGTSCGSISGLVAETVPRLVRDRFIVPRQVYRIDNHALKHYTALRLAVANSRVGWVGTANPSTLVELCRLANRERESLIRDIFDGTLRDAADLPPAVRTALRSAIARRRRLRARELEQIVARTGTFYPRDIWPQLSLISVWTGGSVSIYLPQLPQYFGELPLRDHGLGASEGRMTLPLADGNSAGLLEFAAHFFEFVPVAEYASPQPVVLEAHELAVDQDYYVLLTTSSGLYRYDMHDVVRCVGFVGAVPLLTFLNKGSHFSNFTGEKLSEFQVVTAVCRGFAACGLPTVEFTLAPCMGERLCYVLLLEQPPDEPQRAALAEAVDRELRQLNCEYAEKRQSQRLERLTIRSVPHGTWLAMRLRKTAERGNFEEYKHPCLVNDPAFVERVAIPVPPGSDPCASPN